MKIHSLVACLALLSATAAHAQRPAGPPGPPGPPPSPEVMAARAAVGKACEADTKSMCAGKEGHEAMMCLRALPQDKVSGGCKEAQGKLVKLMTPK